MEVVLILLAIVIAGAKLAHKLKSLAIRALVALSLSAMAQRRRAVMLFSRANAKLLLTPKSPIKSYVKLISLGAKIGGARRGEVCENLGACMALSRLVTLLAAWKYLRRRWPWLKLGEACKW